MRCYIFGENCLQEILEKRADGDRNLRVFSAACSSGEEPYTLAIILREMLDDFKSWNVLVKGVDIDENVLAAALKAEYDSRENHSGRCRRFSSLPDSLVYYRLIRQPLQ